MQGYIKDHRKELESDIWMMPPHYHRIWQYLKYSANHQDKRIPFDDWFITIKAGQHLTSIRKIAKGVGWYERGQFKELNPKTVSKVLEWLVNQKMITVSNGQSNNKYTLVTLLNWESYQTSINEGNDESNGEGTPKEQLLDINKNVKECLKNDFTTTATNMRMEESDGVLTADRNGESVSKADEISHTSADPVRTILDKYIQLRGSGFMESTKDFTAAQEIVGAGVKLDDALEWLQERFDTYAPRHNRDRIQSLDYCVGFILDRHHDKQSRQDNQNGVSNDDKISKRGRSYGGYGKVSKTAEELLAEVQSSKEAWGG
ncbi:DNA-binding transcriptional regulator YhcF (GntR family) [Geomicrobium sediminis]|uniref:DNA-binding transcriptional regulator YhcF (GntR family) n=2 Tax=Geomicrobium sediminis TaxID=1347788 RepID=A0ABS2PEM3_9BACL|nr:DNA-binding transcriptional regulator YhcF (GntR family) [Geomicrobium sediminis]